MFKDLLTMYLPSYPTVLVYMLQSTEYQVKPYLRWYGQITNFNMVMRRRKLDKTVPARLLLMSVRLGIALQIGASITLLVIANRRGTTPMYWYAAALLASYPVVWAYALVVPLVLGRLILVAPKEKILVQKSRTIFREHAGATIAVLGSYGKTSMKEILLSVLSVGKKVAATPANKNVPVSHAYFAAKLRGDEDILIIEYGEGKLGDIRRFAEVTQPDIAVITGLAPAHLDKYPSLKSAGKDLFSISQFVPPEKIYVNAESPAIKPFLKRNYRSYDSKLVLGWQIDDVSVDFDGVRFKMTKDKEVIELRSSLLGRHQVGPLAFAAALGHDLGLTKAQIQEGVTKIQPVEHRMQPRFVRGAWIIDDAYNGNIDGMKAGLKLLAELPARRRIYITPGLVDQGEETQAVHVRLGEAIAKARPDQVVLMVNSVTEHIQHGLRLGGFKGDLVLEEDPLNFYTNIEHYIAAGDVILMQNDWTDNYN